MNQGVVVSKGIAVGRAFLYKPFSAGAVEGRFPESCLEEQIAKYRAVLDAAEKELRSIIAKFEESDPEKAAIFGAHVEILRDEAVGGEIMETITRERASPDWAVWKIYGDYMRTLDSVGDPLIRERAADLRDVRNRLLRIWSGVPETEKNLSKLSEPVIIVARDLTPSDAATIDRPNVLAIVAESGGAASHSAIIARSYGIPAILGVEGVTESVAHGQELIVDALDGILILDPGEAEKRAYAKKREEFFAEREREARYMSLPPLTSDGTRVEIGLNMESASIGHDENCAGFVGLFRTEFLYMENSRLPDEESQFEAYKSVLEKFSPRPVTIRTLDIGGDKTPEYMTLPREDNPSLGNRAIRLCFAREDIFRTQLRAMLRASVHGNLWVMLPMIGSVDDIRRAKRFIDSVKSCLDSENIPYSPEMKVGIMIEIPSIAVIADIAADEADFASIGTNDLCQYLTAADRLNPAVSSYYQSYHPALFRLIGHVAAKFGRAGKPLSVCGELAGDCLAAPALLGLGIRRLSMGVNSMAEVKRVISKLSIEKMREMADAVKNMRTASDVESYLRLIAG
jgi:phosphotransferase system enzyme I (PtsI)